MQTENDSQVSRYSYSISSVAHHQASRNLPFHKARNNKTVRLVTCDRKIPEALDVGGTQQQAGYSYAHAHILSAYAESCPVPVRHTETKGLYDLCSFHGRGHANQITCAESIGIIRKYNTSRVPHFRECHLCSLLISGLFRQSNLKWLKEKLKITLS